MGRKTDVLLRNRGKRLSGTLLRCPWAGWWRGTVVRASLFQSRTLCLMPDGMEFAHWFQVDQQLRRSHAPYDFERPITGITYIMAHYTLPARSFRCHQETNEPVDIEANPFHLPCMQRWLSKGRRGGRPVCGAAYRQGLPAIGCATLARVLFLKLYSPNSKLETMYIAFGRL